jgi:hypothetical protein
MYQSACDINILIKLMDEISNTLETKNYEVIMNPDIRNLLACKNFDEIKEYFKTNSAIRFCETCMNGDSRDFTDITTIQLIYSEALYESLYNNDTEAIAKIQSMITNYEHYYNMEKNVCGKVLDKCFEKGTLYLIINSSMMLNYTCESLDYINNELSDQYIFELHAFLINHHNFFNSNVLWSVLMTGLMSMSLDDCKQILDLWFGNQIIIDISYMFENVWTKVYNIPRLKILVKKLLDRNLVPPSKFISYIIANKVTEILEIFYEYDIDVVTFIKNIDLDKHHKEYYNILTKFGIDMELYLKCQSNFYSN